MRLPAMDLSEMNWKHSRRTVGVWTRVSFLGQLNREQVKYLLMSSDAMILVSKWEGSPLVLREALSSGTPVICADIGDAFQLIHDETCGYIMREPTEESLAEAMEKVYSRGGERVPKDYSAEFSWDGIAERFIVVYEQAFRDTRRGREGA